MIRSLRLKLAFFLIVPVALLLLVTGIVGFIYARQSLLKQWENASILRLQRASHQMDMRLSRPIEWMEMFNKAGDDPGGQMVQQWILSQLKHVEGVAKVDLKWAQDEQLHDYHMQGRGSHMGSGEAMRFHHGRISEVTSPRFHTDLAEHAVSLISELRDKFGRIVGKLEVAVLFEYLMQDIRKFGWWQSELACLVDRSGRYLAHAEAMRGRTRLGETGDPAELAMLAKMQEAPYGTYIAPGHPSPLVGGFYGMRLAPWVLVMFAPGKAVLGPVLRFSLYYSLGGCLGIAFVLFLIHFVGGKTVRSIREISRAAAQVAKGNYGEPLSVRTGDEMGQLVNSFNRMVEGLKERDFINNTFGRYVDHAIARELLKRPEASRLGGEKREVAILMSDIRGFTAISESLSPEGTITMLNDYFSHMIDVIQEHQGIIVDFFGDGVLVFFDPLDRPVDSVTHQALVCAMDMQSRMGFLNIKMREKKLPVLQTGIGVNVGEVVVGNIGSAKRAKYGIVGSAVNITQRIESMAKGGQVIVSESAYRYLQKNLIVRNSFEAKLKGIQEKMILHVVEGLIN